MPAAYAHFRLGEQIREELSEYRQRIDRYRQLFTIGLQGPDILFYYHPLRENPVSRAGNSFHTQSGRSFFSHARDAVRSASNPEAAQVYAYGVLCHFALDATCHGYVEQLIQETGVSHTEIESELERELMLEDGKDFRRFSPLSSLVASRENARVIAPFYSPVTPKEIQGAISGMVLENRLLLAPNRAKRELIYWVLRISGNYDALHGLVISPTENPACASGTVNLQALCREARQRAGVLIQEFDSFLAGGQLQNELFDFDFDGNRHP